MPVATCSSHSVSPDRWAGGAGRPHEGAFPSGPTAAADYCLPTPPPPPPTYPRLAAVTGGAAAEASETSVLVSIERGTVVSRLSLMVMTF